MATRAAAAGNRQGADDDGDDTDGMLQGGHYQCRHHDNQPKDNQIQLAVYSTVQGFSDRPPIAHPRL